MTLLFENDFEPDFSIWSGGIYAAGNATFTASSDYAHHGSKSAKLALNSTFTDQVGCYTNLSSEQELCYLRFVWKPTAWTSTVAAERDHCLAHFSSFLNGVGGMFWLFAMQTAVGNKVFHVDYRDGVVLQPGVDFSAWVVGTVYTIEIFKNCLASGTYAVYINGTLVWSVAANTSSYKVKSVAIANIWGGAGGTDCSATESFDCVRIATTLNGVEVTNAPIVYAEESTVVKEATQMPSTTSAVMGNHGARVRTVRHLTPISPWTAE